MKYTRFKLLFIFAIFVCATGLAQESSFDLVQPRTVIEGRNFTLTFRLTNGEANPPAAPKLDNCTLLYGPSTSTMSSTQIINGKMTSSYSVDYSFVYRADKAGEVSVPAVSVRDGSKNLSSRPGRFNILPDDGSSSPVNGRPAGQPRQTAPSAPASDRISQDDLLVRVSFSRNKVYEQEPVIATIKVYTKYDISSFLVTTQPAFEGFLSEELPVQLETNTENYNGQNYHTAVLKRLLLYPQHEGKLSVNTGKYEVTLVQHEQINMGYFVTYRPVERKITTTSNAATLDVMALPQPQPDGFNGAVGKFTVRTELTPELLRTNEAATYSYIIEGTGNIKFLNEPKIKFPAGVDTYTPKTDIDTRVAGANMTGTFRTDFTIVPQEVGSLKIEGTPFVYFDPESRQYKTLPVDTYDVKVIRGSSTSTETSTKAVDTQMDDILHIVPSGSMPQQKVHTYLFDNIYYWLAYAVALAVLITVIIVYRRHIRLAADVTGRRLARAGRVANKRLREARKYLRSGDSDAFYASLAKALWGYVSDKLSIAPSQLMRDNIESRLTDFGADETGVSGMLEILDECEMARFTPNHTESEKTALYDKAVSVINNIENTRH